MRKGKRGNLWRGGGKERGAEVPNRIFFHVFEIICWLCMIGVPQHIKRFEGSGGVISVDVLVMLWLNENGGKGGKKEGN